MANDPRLYVEIHSGQLETELRAVIPTSSIDLACIITAKFKIPSNLMLVFTFPPSQGFSTFCDNLQRYTEGSGEQLVFYFMRNYSSLPTAVVDTASQTKVEIEISPLICFKDLKRCWVEVKDAC